MEVDEARLAAMWAVPRLEERLDRLVAEVIGKFKGGILTQEAVQQLRADWLATSRLLNELKQVGGLNG